MYSIKAKIIIMEANKYRQELRLKIINTASKLFMEKGVKSVKMDDIAQTLSISKRTLYEIFADKESLLYEVIATLNAQFRNRIERLTAKANDVMEIVYHFYTLTITELNNVNPVFLNDVAKYPSVLKKLEKGTQTKHIAYFKFIERGVKEGYFMPGIDYGLVEEIVDLSSRAMRANKLPNKYGAKKTFVTTTVLFLRGICTEKGLRRLDEIIAEQVK